VRPTLVVVVFVAITGVAGALAYSALANERAFERRIGEGDQAVAAERHFEAIEAFSGAIALKPDSMLAHLKRGAVYLNQNELDAALRDLREAVELDPGALLAIELLGDVNASLNRADRAIERYQAYLNLDERSARVHYKLGLSRYRAGRLEPAASALQQALKLDPALGDAHYVLGLVLRDQDQLPGARRSLEEAARRLPAGRTAPREALAEVYALDGEHTRAINELEALAALDVARADRLVAVGLAQARAGREAAAVVTLSRALERFPDAPAAYAALGHIWLTSAERRGDRVALNKALEALQQAAGRSDATSDTLAELGRAWLLAGDRPAAERALRQAVARLPVPPDAYLQLAEVMSRDGRIQEARDALLKYATLVGDDKPLAAVSSRIADMSLRLGEPALAVRWLERVINEAGPSTALQIRLADAALRGGDRQRARHAVEEALAAEPGNRQLLQLRLKLDVKSEE
jgi:tetratricopeptide (TPR) repeat protein